MKYLGALFVAVLISAMPVLSQQPPDLEQGLKPFGAYQHGNIDSVNLANGNLFVHIPLFSLPQRGSKLKLDFDILYNNKGWYVYNMGSTHQWRFRGISSTVNVGPLQGASATDSIIIVTDLYQDKIRIHHYSIGTSDGSSHDVGITTTPDNGISGTGETIDGSGINYGGTVVIDRNGIRYPGNQGQSGTSVTEDPNGNKITFNSSGWTDTLGRAIPLTSIPNGGTYGTFNYSFIGVPSTTTNCPSGTATAMALNLPAYNGSTSIFKFCFADFNFQTSFNSAGVTENSGTYRLMNAVVLPDLTMWKFNYNLYLDLTSITFPTGGSMSYSWATHGFDSVSRVVTQRILNANDGTGTHTSTYQYGVTINGVQGLNVFTDPAGNDTVRTPCVDSGYICKSQYYSGPYSSGTLLKTTATQFHSDVDPYDAYTGQNTYVNVFPLSTTITWPNGKVSQSTTTYDSGFTYYIYDPITDSADSYTSYYGAPMTNTVSDYGQGSPGGVLRTTKTNYTWQSDSTYLTANLLNLPSSVQVFDNGATAQTSYTSYTYGDTVSSSGITEQRNTTPSSPHRGNLLSVSRWLNGSTVSTTNCPVSVSNGNLTSTSTYYDTGMVYQATDVCGHTTTNAYSGTYYGAYPTQTTRPSTSSPNPATHVVSGAYDFNTGFLSSFTDESGNQSSFTYDTMWRISSATLPAVNGVNGQISFYYPNPTTVERTEKIDGSRTTDMYVAFDGVGREIRRITANDESTPWDQVDTCYDSAGRTAFVTYPYQGSGLSAPSNCPTHVQPGDTYSYDGLSRVTSVAHSDGTSIVTAYTGAATSVTDEGNGTRSVQRISQVDGLGRVVSVCEVSSIAMSDGPNGTPAACGQDISGTGFLTSYSYGVDSSSNLTFTIQQPGLNQRYSATDSLGWLVTATNPESGTIIYGYDADGNVVTRTAPQPNQTGSSTVTTTITYDPLHRVRTKSYSDSTTPTATFNYDETSVLGRSLTNTIGRASSSFMTTVVSPVQTQAAEVYSYNAMGHLIDNSQCTPQNCGSSTAFPVTYTYDLVGDELTGTNGLGTTLTYAYNRAARLTGVTSSLSDANHPGTLLSGVHYNAFGGPTASTLGTTPTNTVNTFGYAPRGWLQSLTAQVSSTTVYSFSLGFSGDGDVTSANDSINGNWTYTYDDFNRLLTSNKNSGQSAFSYDYDRYGNRWHQTLTAGSGTTSSLGFDANNHIVSGSGVSYDAAGNVIGDSANPIYVYDAENRIICVGGSLRTASCMSSAPTVYYYNAGGDRIRKTTGGVAVDYLYDLGSHVITEVNSSGGWNRGEIFAGSHHLATYNAGTTYFTHADWLGTERARANLAGTAVETCTNQPFGDNQVCTGSDVSPLHFTGKQRDIETNNDDFGARYFNSNTARWLTPDWSARPEGTPYATLDNPQTLNLYAYVGNRPTSVADPDGHEFLAPRSHFVCPDYFDMPDSTPPGLILTETQENAIAAAAQNTPALVSLSSDVHYTVANNGPNAPEVHPVFSPETATHLNAAFKELNKDGIIPQINSAFRTDSDQAHMQSGGSGTNPAAKVSWHEAGAAVDINGTRSPQFKTIVSVMKKNGFVWGGDFKSKKDPPHFDGRQFMGNLNQAVRKAQGYWDETH